MTCVLESVYRHCRRAARASAYLICFAPTGAAQVTAAQNTADVRPLAYTRVVLPNGLVAVLNEDHSAPIVSVDLWYHIGSADERVGQAGFAHMCEHLMDDGSPNQPDPHSTFLRSLGATSGGRANSWATTTAEYTQYFATIPSRQLETVLWLEADGMASPLSRADAQRFDGLREVVRQERQSRVENQVFAASIELARASLYPGDHPYRGPPLPPMADLDAATADQVKAFCLPYYVPSNAVIALSGDFRAPDAKRLIEKYFGPIARGAPPARRVAPPVFLPVERRLVLEDPRARVSSIRFWWPGVGFSHADKVPLYALAGVLSGDKYGFARFGRLSKLLVQDRQLATAVHAELYDGEDSGDFLIDVTPRLGASLTAIEEVVDSVVAVLRGAPISQDELTRFNNLNAVRAATSLQSRAARTDTLAQGEVFARNPGEYAKQVERGLRLNVADVQRVARQYLTRGRIVMSLVPAGKVDQISKPELPYLNVTPSSQRPGQFNRPTGK